MPDILVTDAVLVIDAGSLEQLYLLISVSDITDASDAATVSRTWDYLEISVSDTTDASDAPEVIVWNYSAYDSVSILDSPTVALNSFFDQLEEMTLPTRFLVGEFARNMTTRKIGVSVPLRIPVREGLGYFGARLSEERIPLRTISANIADPDIGLSGGVNKLPTWSMSGSFGMRLDEYIPVRTLSASFDLAGTFSLDAFIPTRRLAGTFKPPSSFTLSRQIPIWMGQGNMVLTEPGASLSVKIPGAFIFTGTLHEVGGFRLTANIPVWRLESSIYASSFVGDGNIPGPVPINLIISYHSRFTDYVLRYIRP